VVADLIGAPWPERPASTWPAEGAARAEAELTALYDTEVDRLVAFLCGSDRSVRFQDAEELAVAALLVAREHWALVRAQGNPSAFVFSVAQRRLTTFRRVRAANGEAALPSRRTPLATAGDLASALRLEATLERLSYRQRQIVLLRELLGFGATETATILDLTEEKIVDEVGDGTGVLSHHPEGRRASGVSAAVRAEEFAALGRSLRRGPRRRALARRRFVSALREAEGRPSAVEIEAGEPPPPGSPSGLAGRAGPPDGVVVDLRPPAGLPRRTAGSGVSDELPPAPVDPGVAVMLRTSAVHGCERDPAFLRRVLAGLRRL
jgi:DNA-directed RNA polymerase specialized sigma24 family protein